MHILPSRDRLEGHLNSVKLHTTMMHESDEQYVSCLALAIMINIGTASLR